MTVRLIDRKARASEILLDIGAVRCNLEQPYIFTSGWASPVYVDCRKLISTARERREVIQLAAEEIDRSIGRQAIDLVAGGETAGIFGERIGPASPGEQEVPGPLRTGGLRPAERRSA
jgi:hypothetical protein